MFQIEQEADRRRGGAGGARRTPYSSVGLGPVTDEGTAACSGHSIATRQANTEPSPMRPATEAAFPRFE